MKNYYGYSILLFLAVLTYSCSDKDAAYDGIRLIDGNGAVPASLEEFATDIDVIPLHSDEPVDVDYIGIYGDELLVVDSRLEKLWYFKDFQLVSTLSAKGRGAGEYDLINYCAYSPSTHTLYIAPSNRKCILHYDVPSMRYKGVTQFADFYSRSFDLTDDSTFVMVRRFDDGRFDMAVVDANTGTVKKSMDIIENGEGFFMNVTSRTPYRNAVGLDGRINRIGLLEADGRFVAVDSFRFADGLPEKVVRNNSSDDLSEKLKAVSYKFTEHYCDGMLRPVINENGYCFWYSYHNPVDGSPSRLHLYGWSGDREIHVQEFTVPGTNVRISSFALTSDNRYVDAIQGPAEMIMDSKTAQSPLARRIISALDNQNDDNPVLIYYRIPGF